MRVVRDCGLLNARVRPGHLILAPVASVQELSFFFFEARRDYGQALHTFLGREPPLHSLLLIGYRISCSLARDDKKAIESSERTPYIIPAFVI